MRDGRHMAGGQTAGLFPKEMVALGMGLPENCDTHVYTEAKGHFREENEEMEEQRSH